MEGRRRDEEEKEVRAGDGTCRRTGVLPAMFLGSSDFVSLGLSVLQLTLFSRSLHFEFTYTRLCIFCS